MGTGYVIDSAGGASGALAFVSFFLERHSLQRCLSILSVVARVKIVQFMHSEIRWVIMDPDNCDGVDPSDSIGGAVESHVGMGGVDIVALVGTAHAAVVARDPPAPLHNYQQHS